MGGPRLGAPPGGLVDVGGFRLHVSCAGQGRPTVVFDAALGGSTLSWSLVQPQVAAFTATCSYDRAGLGWSDAGPPPRSAGRIAAELRTLLDRTATPPPYVLVGHSFGTLVARLFTARYKDDVAGLVLVEPAFPEDWIDPKGLERRRMRRGVRMCRYAAIAARLGLTRTIAMLARDDAAGLARAAVRFVNRRRSRRGDEELLVPILKLPPESRELLTAMWMQPRFFDALGSHIGSIAISASEAIDAGTSFGSIPIVVVSATNPHPHQAEMQERLVRMSPRGRRVVATASGHWVPLEEPETIVAAVRDVVATVRSERRPQSATG